MTALTTNPPIHNPLSRLFEDEPIFAYAGILLALLSVPTMAAMGLDDRLFQGVNPWVKPLKFELSLSLYLLSLAFFARFAQNLTQGRVWRLYAAICVAMIAAEMVWIGNGARLAEPSHFNTTPVGQAIYGLMGLFALTFTAASAVIGVAILRRDRSPLAVGIGLSLILTLVLTGIVAGTMSSGTSHFVGEPVTGDALPIMGWSREVGDLRVAHFFATHAMHFIPGAALAITLTVPARRQHAAVFAATLAFTAFTVFAFVQALNGQPFV